MQDGSSLVYRNLTGFGSQNPGYQPRHALLRLKDGRLVSGCGGNVEILHLEETLRAMDTGQVIQLVSAVTVFGSKDTVRAIKTLPSSDHIFVVGSRHAALVHGSELFESTVLAESRLLSLPGPIVAVDVEKQSKNELLLTFLLETGVYHYSLSVEETGCSYECLQVFRCNRIIQSGILWRDGGVLHVAYYDGYIRVGIINENYDDMLLIKKIAVNKNHLPGLLTTLSQEVERLSNFEEEEKVRRGEMLNLVKKLQGKFSPAASEHENGQSDEALVAAHQDFVELRTSFKNHSIRSERISQRLLTLKKFIPLVSKALDAFEELEMLDESLEREVGELEKISRLYDECVQNGDHSIIDKSRNVLEEKKYELEKLLRQAKMAEMSTIVEEWDKKIASLVETLSGLADSPKDIRNILSHSIFEHRPEKSDKFTHFLLDYSARDLTLYCMSGLTTLAIYPRRGLRVASISLDASYETSLTCACLMSSSLDGVYVADDKGVFPIFFNRQRNRASPSNRDKRYFDAGNQLILPAFDVITSILMEEEGMILGSMSGGLLHLAFDKQMRYDHVVMASSMLANPFSQGAILDVKVLCFGGTYLAVSASSMEIAISERDNDRWHRITCHQVPAHCLDVTSFSNEHRGAFIIAGSSVYCRIKALQYNGDLVGLHDLGESKVNDENGKPIEVLNVSIDPSMEFRPFPCKLRYAVGYGDKAIRTYVALLTGDHQFNVAEKFIAQIEPLHNVSQLVCFNGRPMGCYTFNSKTLQVWNDLDRHQQKKMKSERMELHKMDVGIAQLCRVEGRSCYLLMGMKDGRIDIYEERGKGTGKIDLAGTITAVPGALQGILTRSTPTATGDRLFIHTQDSGKLHIYTALVEGGKILNFHMLISSTTGLANLKSFSLLPGRPFEFLLYGSGLCIHRLTENERKLLDEHRDFHL